MTKKENKIRSKNGRRGPRLRLGLRSSLFQGPLCWSRLLPPLPCPFCSLIHRFGYSQSSLHKKIIMMISILILTFSNNSISFSVFSFVFLSFFPFLSSYHSSHPSSCFLFLPSIRYLLSTFLSYFSLSNLSRLSL